MRYAVTYEKTDAGVRLTIPVLGIEVHGNDPTEGVIHLRQALTHAVGARNAELAELEVDT